MARYDIYLKLETDVKGEEKPEKLAAEICRQLMKLYGVRSAELVNYVQQD